MTIIYVKTTIPELPESVRVSINSVIQQHNGPQATLNAIRRAAARRRVNATYELATREEYLEYRRATEAAIAGAQASQSAV
jgi:hypothetical protein